MMNNTFEYRFSKIELEQFATFEENFQCEKEISFQTNTSFSFDKSNMIFISRIGICATQMEKPILKAEQVCYFELSSETVNSFFKDKKYIFPTNVLIQFASLNYGTLRGAIHVKTLGTVLNKFILPPLYFNTFITSPFQADVNE